MNKETLTLSEYKALNNLELLETLTIGKSLVESLREIHASEVYYKDINPNNII